MASLTVTAAAVKPVFVEYCRIRSHIAAAALTPGQSVFTTSAGKADLCQANSAGKEQFRGIALETVGAGQAVDVLEEGYLDGMGHTGLAYDTIVFQSDTPGVLADAASGTKTVRCGRVVAVSDANPADSGKPSKLLYVRSDMFNNW